MAGLTVYLGTTTADRVARAAHRLRWYDETVQAINEDGFSAAWVSHDDARLFGPARDQHTGVLVVTSGRVAWDERDWNYAESLTRSTGGLGNRLLLELYLRDGPAAVCRFSGSASVVVWDPRSRSVHLYTDRFGYHPTFLHCPDHPQQAIVSTLPDAIADDPDVSVSLDDVSIAEFLSAWRVTPPHTYYREISYAGAATHHEWSPVLGHRHSVYWRPQPDSFFPTSDAAAEELAYAIKTAVRIRTLNRFAPVLSFTSGGMDSRVVLFAAKCRSDLMALNLYDAPNHETSVARQLCSAARVAFHGFQRDPDYYPRLLVEGVGLSGAMWSHEDNHFLGAQSRVRELGAKTVVSACTADWLFKGYGLEKSYRRLLGRNLPFRRFEHQRVYAFLPNVPRPVPEPFGAQVRSRLEDWFDGTSSRLTSDADRLEVEDRRIRPACYAVSVSGQIMYRIFPYDTFLADSRIADCYARTRAGWKLNAEVWAAAVRRICVEGRQIEDANFGWRVGSPAVVKAARFATGWAKRRLRPSSTTAGDALATEGSWPNLGWYVRHSASLRDFWESVGPGTREVVTAAWGCSPWAQPLEQWAESPNALFRILTMSAFLSR
jgi:hypothetical protein